MKRVAILFILTLFVWGCGQKETHDDLNWTTDLGKALQLAKQENKAVLVNFTGSDWCKWCFKLSDEVFSQDEFKEYADKNLVLVKVDFPEHKEQTNQTKMYNKSLAKKFGVQGFPTIIIINSGGRMVAKTGYQAGGPVNYINHIKSFLSS
ncbi:disulfide bond reductase DsbH precursor [bacterium BMS3Abin03]|nr:disulfide bond reductase DsbH precursor [bacterium BMS3Abin03]